MELKDGLRRLLGFARQRWRAWIETLVFEDKFHEHGSSPVSDGGRGLKLAVGANLPGHEKVRPSAMAGVD